MALNTVWSLTPIFLNLSKTSIWNSNRCPNSCTSHTKPLSTPLAVFPDPIPTAIAQSFLGVEKMPPPWWHGQTGELSLTAIRQFLHKQRPDLTIQSSLRMPRFNSWWRGRVGDTANPCPSNSRGLSWGPPPVVSHPVFPVLTCAFLGLYRLQGNQALSWLPKTWWLVPYRWL